MKQIRVLCIGDSMGLPREGVSYRETWVYQMKEKFQACDFISCFTRGMLIGEAVSHYQSDYQFYDADCYIVQTGICDCSPRYINDRCLIIKMIITLARKMKMEGLFWSIIKKVFTRTRNCVYTSEQEFTIQFRTLLAKLMGGGKSVIVIKIGKASPAVLERNKYINQNVERYNAIIDEVIQEKGGNVIAIDPLNLVNAEMFVDGYHCNRIGMEMVFSELSDAFKMMVR